MTPEERLRWIDEAFLELVNDGKYYRLHQGRLASIVNSGLSPYLSMDLRPKINVFNRNVVKYKLLLYYSEEQEVFSSPLATPTQDKTMKSDITSEVQVKVFVGDNEADKLSTDDLLRAIKKEEESIKELEMINNRPKKVDAIIVKKKENIQKLVDLVDSK